MKLPTFLIALLASSLLFVACGGGGGGGDEVSPPPSPPRMAKVSGDNQTVAQHVLLPLELVVDLVGSAGEPLAGVSVVFSSSAAGIASATVTSDTAGRARWAGYFHSVGSFQVQAMAAGIAQPITFSVTITASIHVFDGGYDCSYKNNGNGFQDTFSFSIVGGLIPATGTHDQRNVITGTFDESTGHAQIFKQRGLTGRDRFEGVVTVNTPQPPTVSGSLYPEVGDVLLGPWSCIRR